MPKFMYGASSISNYSFIRASIEKWCRDNLKRPFWENGIWSLETLFLIIMQISLHSKTTIKIIIWIFIILVVFGSAFCRWHRLAWILNLISTGPVLQNSRSSSWPWTCHQCTKDKMYVAVNCNPQPALQVYGDPSNHVSDFRYLGSMVASGSSDLKRRKSLAWCAFWKLEQHWKSPHTPIATKVKLFNTTYKCHSTTLWLWIMGDLPGHGKQNQHLCYLMLQSHAEYKAHWPCSEVLNTTVYSMTNTVAQFTWSHPPNVKGRAC